MGRPRTRARESSIRHAQAFRQMPPLRQQILSHSKQQSPFSKGFVMYVVVSSPQCGKKCSFFPVFHLAGFMAEAFCWLFPWNVIEKGISHFLWRSLFYCLFLWNFKEVKHQPFSITQPFKKRAEKTKHVRKPFHTFLR